MENIEEMNLIELAEFWVKDWEQDAPELDKSSTMRSWERRVEKLIHSATELELLQFLHRMRNDECSEQVELARRMLFIDPLDDRIKVIEASMKTLLKQFENEPANITIGQLNRLKGGLR